jgi:hypothetical protein
LARVPDHSLLLLLLQQQQQQRRFAISLVLQAYWQHGLSRGKLQQ